MSMRPECRDNLQPKKRLVMNSKVRCRSELSRKDVLSKDSFRFAGVRSFLKQTVVEEVAAVDAAVDDRSFLICADALSFDRYQSGEGRADKCDTRHVDEDWMCLVVRYGAEQRYSKMAIWSLMWIVKTREEESRRRKDGGKRKN